MQKSINEYINFFCNVGQGNFFYSHSLTVLNNQVYSNNVFDLWTVYSGKRFRVSWPSCFIYLINIHCGVYFNRLIGTILMGCHNGKVNRNVLHLKYSLNAPFYLNLRYAVHMYMYLNCVIFADLCFSSLCLNHQYRLRVQTSANSSQKHSTASRLV